MVLGSVGRLPAPAARAGSCSLPCRSPCSGSLHFSAKGRKQAGSCPRTWVRCKAQEQPPEEPGKPQAPAPVEHKDAIKESIEARSAAGGGDAAGDGSSTSGRGSRPAGDLQIDMTNLGRQLLAVLVEEGGAVGTAAVIIGLLTHVDPFGSFHWDLQDLRLGLLFFLPVLFLDFALLVPDYSVPKAQVKDAIRLLVNPELLEKLKQATANKEQQQQQGPGVGAAADGISLWDLKLGLVGLKIPELVQEGAALSTQEGWLLRARLALEMREERFLSRPRSAVWMSGVEVFATLVTCLAEEMLYRAVLLTLLSLWIRDRLYEGGAEDLIPLAGGLWNLDTLQAAQLGAVGLGVSSGLLAYGLNAVGRLQSLEKMSKGLSQVVSEELGKRRPAALPGWGKPAAPGSEAAGPAPASEGSGNGLSAQLNEEVGLEMQLALGRLDSMVLAIEGLREVAQVAASGLAFVATGNLAASYASSVLTQVMFSAHRSAAMQRRSQKRAAVMNKAELRMGSLKQQRQQQRSEQQPGQDDKI